MAEEVDEPESESKKEASPEPDPGMISLEDIDKFLEDDSPEFAKSLSEIVPEELGDDVEIDSVDLDEKNLVGDEVEEKIEKSRLLQRFPKIQAKLDKILNPIKSVPTRIGGLALTAKNAGFDLSRAAWKFLKTELPEKIKYWVSQVKALFAWLKGHLQKFWAKSWPEKILYFGALSVVMGLVALLVLNVSGRWLPTLFDSYVRSFGSRATVIEKFGPDDVEPLGAAFPQQTFTVLLEKIVVNLQRSRGHRNPMGAFKFYVTVDSQETAVEVKDRETEILDYVQRAVEEMSYEEVNGPGGRTQLKALVRAEVNRLLNQGRVQEVFIEIMITKP